MPSSSTSVFSTKLTTHECEELNVFSKLNGWQANYQQLGAGQFESRFELYVSEHLHVTDQHCNREMVASGVPPAGQIALFMLLNEGDRGIFNGKALQDNEVFIMRNRSEGTLKTPAHLRMINLQVSETRLRQALMSMADCELDHYIPNTHRMTLPRHTIRCLAELSSHVLGHTRESSPMQAPDIRQYEAEELLISTLVTGLTAPLKTYGTVGRKQRKNAVLLAREYIETHLDRPIGLETLARKTGVSTRTLESAFREVYDTTPLRYIKLRRLHRVRRHLLQIDDRKFTVAEIAKKCGFSHMSYFSRDYKALFAEYPSDTLHNVR